MQFLKSVNWKSIPNMPRVVIEWITSFIEFLTDHLHGSLGHIMIKASPLMAPAPSAIAIYGSLHDRFGAGNALAMTFVFEALGFAAVYIKTRLEQHNRSQPANMQPLDKANIAVTAYFLVTEVSIILFEVIPSWAQWYVDGDLVTALTHTAPVIFPMFSYIGANIYSMMDSLTEIEERAAAELAEKKENVDAKIAALVAERDRLLIDVETGKVELAGRSEKLQNDLQNALSDRIKVDQEVAVLRTQARMLESQLSSVTGALERFQDHSLNGPVSVRQNGSGKRSESRSYAPNAERRTDKKRLAQVVIVKAIKERGSLPYAELGTLAGIAKSTVHTYVTDLSGMGVIDRTDNGDGTVTLSVNGNHEAFLSGKL